MADSATVSEGKSIADAYRGGTDAPTADHPVVTGKAIADAYRTQAAETPPPADTTQGDTIAPELRSLLAPAPNTEYGSALPIARDLTTGQTRWAMPNFLRESARGILDLVEGPITGTVTPEGTMTLLDAATLGRLGPSVARGTGKEVARSMERQAIERAAPLSPEFKAAPVAPDLVQAAQGTPAPSGVGNTPVGPVSPVPNAPPQGPLIVPPSSAAPAPPTGANLLNPAASAPPSAALLTAPTAAPPTRIMPIVTQAQAEAEADRIIRHFAGNQSPTINAAPLASGAQPTLSQAIEGGHAGIAALERGIRDVPEQTQHFTARETANTALRNKAVGDVIGDPRATDVVEADLNARTRPQEERIFDPARTKPVDTSATVARIDEILKSGSGQRDAVTDSLTHLRSKLVAKDGTLQSDPAQLRGIDLAIGDMISPKAAGTARDGRAAAHELMDVRSILRGDIESGAPGYQDFLASQAAERSAIDGQRFLQARNITDRQGNVNLGTLDSTIKAAERQQRMPGARLADGVTDEQLARLKQLREDYQTDAKQRLGTSIGSPTVQKLGVSGAMGAMGHPLLAGAVGSGGALLAGINPAVGAMLGVASYGMKQQSAAAQRMVIDALRDKLLNPSKASSAFKPNP